MGNGVGSLSEVLIRPVEVDDAEQLLDYFQQIVQETQFILATPEMVRGYTVEFEREWIKNLKKNAEGFVAEVDGKIVGFLGLRRGTSPRNRHYAELGITILKEYWGRGIATRLMETMFEWARKNGVKRIFLRVMAHNERAYRLYKKLGFVEEGRFKRDVMLDDGTYMDTIAMAKWLD
jgi:RimJ/RimL family protein N-acetyltransferase